MTRREGIELLVLTGLVIGVQVWSVWGDVTYTQQKNVDGTVTVTQTETFTKPADKVTPVTYSKANLAAWLQAAKDQKAANDVSRASAAVADQQVITDRQAMYDAAVAAGVQ